MTNLLTRLEAAKEGSREMDKLMWEFVSDIPYHEWSLLPPPPRPAFTTSRDAIIELIERELPGWKRLSCSDGIALLWRGKDTSVSHLAPTECLALCIAFVKAKEAKDE